MARYLASIAADLVVCIHLAYVVFVIFGQVLILFGWLGGWSWVRNVWFRGIHLAAIGIVVLESWVDITCPLTTLEHWLRTRAGQVGHPGAFLGQLVHDLLFVEVAPWILTSAYTAFGVLVLASLLLIPPRRMIKPVRVEPRFQPPD